MARPSYEYSGVCYITTADQTTFPLTTQKGNAIGYLEAKHIKVRWSDDSGGTWNSLALNTDWVFADPATSITLTSALAAGVWLDIHRETPVSEDYIRFNEGSLLTAAQLNEFDTWQLYIDQEIIDGQVNLDGGLDDRYVKKTGDDMTGNLTLGTDKITLDATNGSVEAATYIKLGDRAVPDKAGEVLIARGNPDNSRYGPFVNVYVRAEHVSDSNPSPSFCTYNLDTNQYTFTVDPGGTITAESADFKGNVSVGGITFDDDTTITTKPVTKLIAGANILIEPESGVGEVTISAAGGGGGGGSGEIYGGPLPPSDPKPWTLWWNSEDGVIYIYYKDESADEQWVPAAPQGGGGGGGGGGAFWIESGDVLSPETNSNAVHIGPEQQIKLEPSGTGTFDGDVIASDSKVALTSASGNRGRIIVYDESDIQAQIGNAGSTLGGTAMFGVWDNDNDKTLAAINQDGKGTFKSLLCSDGGTSKGSLSLQATTGDSANDEVMLEIYRKKTNGSFWPAPCRILANGNAEFRGKIKTAGLRIDELTTITAESP